jgi:hypothetical protein
LHGALSDVTPGAPNAEAYAEFYAGEGWRVDAAAICNDGGMRVTRAARCECWESLHADRTLPWVEATARQLQQLIRENGQSVARRSLPIEPAAGRLVLFADGLRMDVARKLADRLLAIGVKSTQDWEWSSIPTVTATAKPAASPVADAMGGGEAMAMTRSLLGLKLARAKLLTNDAHFRELR